MLIDSDIKDKSENNLGVQSQEYNNSLSQILSVEIPKTKVIVRKRPLNQKEISLKEVDNISIIEDKKVVVTELKKNLDLTKYLDRKEFIFDKAYDEKASNDKIYKEEIRPMIYSAFYQKSKITCFAYGQTGSGKTYTLFGNSNKNTIFGVYALSGYDIFQIINNDKKFQNLSIFVSFYEIYCGKLYDLLNNRNILETREDYKHDINIVGLIENKINSLEELMKIVNIGSKQRTIGKTGANSESSRSHGIIQLRIFNTEKNSQHAKISFIDLAGSERESDKVNVDKKTRIDGAAINQSLLALKECIRALEQDKIHLPFRTSKLSLVLRDSFIGNCKTLMISTISPGYKTSEHTLNTLRYAYRLKEIKTMGNAAKNFKLNNNNKNISKNNNNDFQNDPNQFISNLLNNNNNYNINNNIKNNEINVNNVNNNDNNKISSESKNNNKIENDFFMDKKPRKRRKSYSSSNSPMKDVNKRDNSNDSNFRKKKKVKFTYDNNNNNKKMKSKKTTTNNINTISGLLNIGSKKESKNNNLQNNNICTLTLTTSNSNQNDNNNNNFNPFNKNNQMNITQQINLNNTHLPNIDNNNNNFSFNLFNNENTNYLNLSNNSLFSFQSSNFNNLSIEELERKNEKMIEDIVNQDKVVSKKQQLHINSMCELIKTEINTFQQYSQEQMDITTYIDAMQNNLQSQNSYYNDFYSQLEKLNYMIKQQIKLSNLIEQMKKNDNNKLNISETLIDNEMTFVEDQNAINLKNLQSIQNQINNIRE